MAASTWHNRITGYGSEAPDQLVANPRNWRIHPQPQQAALEGSLVEVGWVQNVIVNQRTGFVVDGHARVALALKSGQKEVPVTYVDLTDEQEALILATLDPISAMAGADKEHLESLLADINTQDEALLALVGDLAKNHGIGSGNGGLTDPDDVPAAPEIPITKPGDLWLLGDHRLLCGDATGEADLDRLLDGEMPDVLIADPPYGINLDTDYSTMPKTTRGFRPIHGDDAPFDAHPLRKRLTGVREQFWFGADYYARTLGDTEHGGAWLVWDKRVEERYDPGFGSAFELIWSAVRRKRDMLRVQWFQNHSADPNESGARSHPTQKPIDLIVTLMTMTTGTLALDPFLGSGTTLIAAEQLNRRCYGMEIDPTYCDVIVRRWEQFTGQTASRERAEDAA